MLFFRGNQKVTSGSSLWTLWTFWFSKRNQREGIIFFPVSKKGLHPPGFVFFGGPPPKKHGISFRFGSPLNHKQKSGVPQTKERHTNMPIAHMDFSGWEGSPTEIDYRKKVGTLILTSLLEDLGFPNIKHVAKECVSRSLVRKRFERHGLSEYVRSVHRQQTAHRGLCHGLRSLRHVLPVAALVHHPRHLAFLWFDLPRSPS